MSSILIYLDGSSVQLSPKGGKQVSVGWGLVALANDTQVEQFGAHQLPISFSGYHEQIALVEAVRYAHQQGFTPEEVSFYTDDEILRNAQEGLHPGNCRASWTNQLRDRICKLVGHAYEVEMWPLVETYLRGARVNKLKSHRNLVYNHRVDYLAKNAAYSLKESPRAVTNYDDWLAAGFVRYLDNDTTETWFAPFTNSILSM